MTADTRRIIPVAEMIEAALVAVPVLQRRPGSGCPACRFAADRNLSFSATASASAKPMPTKPPVAMVSPSRMRRIAASALTIFPPPEPCNASSIDCAECSQASVDSVR